MVAQLRAFPWIAHLPLPSIQAQGDIKAAVEPLASEIIETAKRNANTSSIKGKDLLSILRGYLVMFSGINTKDSANSSFWRDDWPLPEGQRKWTEQLHNMF